jgi:hypothetical protein
MAVNRQMISKQEIRGLEAPWRSELRRGWSKGVHQGASGSVAEVAAIWFTHRGVRGERGCGQFLMGNVR